MKKEHIENIKYYSLALAIIMCLVYLGLKYDYFGDFLAKISNIYSAISWTLFWAVIISLLSGVSAAVLKKRFYHDKPCERQVALGVSALVAIAFYIALQAISIPRPFGVSYDTNDLPSNIDELILDGAKGFAEGAELSEKQSDDFIDCVSGKISEIKSGMTDEEEAKIDWLIDEFQKDPEANRPDLALGAAAFAAKIYPYLTNCLMPITGMDNILNQSSSFFDEDEKKTLNSLGLPISSPDQPATTVTSTGSKDGAWSLGGVWAYIKNLFSPSDKNEQAPVVANSDAQSSQPIANPDTAEVTEAPNLSPPPELAAAEQPVETDDQYVVSQHANKTAKRPASGPQESAVTTPYSMRRDPIVRSATEAAPQGSNQVAKNPTEKSTPYYGKSRSEDGPLLYRRAEQRFKYYNIYHSMPEKLNVKFGGIFDSLKQRLEGCGIGNLKDDYKYNLSKSDARGERSNRVVAYFTGPFAKKEDAMAEFRQSLDCAKTAPASLKVAY